ncbi:MAG: hypothetical protein F4Z31_05495 [Gemmatimonadetes bacterium]|nr:hypothetical protein [Gemmatimonadota bacterium]MYE94470.1 hypothetical protein [Gemmatimonadota bacterium]MYJ12415.1 hypothetical protein [Gemmatimonadota bacterium]
MKSLEGANWPDEHSGVRQQLIRSIRARRLKYGRPPDRPTDISYHQVVNPESGLPLTRSGMWQAIDQALDSGIPLEPVTLRQPPDERAWVFKFRLASAEPLVYVKLQIIGSHVVLRSFHHSERDHHA